MTNVRKYKSIPRQTDAIQYTKETQTEIKVHLKGYLYLDDFMTVIINGDMHCIALGDWILFHGPIRVMSDAEFKQNYELAND